MRTIESNYLADLPYRSALIVGAGPGVGAALTRSLTRLGVIVSVSSRHVEALSALAQETGARSFSVDTTQAESVARLFASVRDDTGDPEIVIVDATPPLYGGLDELSPLEVERSVATTVLGGFLAVHHAARAMVPRRCGAILLSGNASSRTGSANSAAVAIGQFALRGLAQSAARELGPKGIHVAHFTFDGVIGEPGDAGPSGAPDSMLHPDAIAQTYLDVLCQPRCAWACEVELRPWAE